MAASGTVVPMERFLQCLQRSELIAAEHLSRVLTELEAQGKLNDQPQALAVSLIQRGLLSKFQAQQLLQGKSRGFIIGSKYKMLELLGQGGMGAVYLCEQITLRRLVAVKILPAAELAKDPALLERFYREARAVAALTHPNLVRAYDIDREGQLHFLVMEFIDGINLHDLVAKAGPLNSVQAAHFIAQAAAGLQRAHEAGWVHRDIKPGNLLLDRSGVIKVLDLGLARLRNSQGDQLTQKYDDQATMGTADYLSPEQALHASDVDIRSDLYSLGGTFYFLLAGRAPFFDMPTVPQKLLAHQMKEPTSLLELRPDMPRELNAVIKKLMRKQPDDRFQTPAELIEALKPWTRQTLELPPAEVMPKWPPIVRQLLGNRSEVSGPASATLTPTVTEAGSPTSPISVTPLLPKRGSSGSVSRSSLSRSNSGSGIRQPPSAASAPATRPGSSPGGPSKLAAPGSGVKKGEPRRRSLPRWALASVLGLVLVACVVAVVQMLSGGKPKGLAAVPQKNLPAKADSLSGSNSGTLGGASPAHAGSLPATGRAAKAIPNSARDPLYVVDDSTSPPTGAERIFPSISAALDVATPGTRIVVLPEVVRESLVLEDGRRGMRVTIEAGPTRDGLPVRWKPSPVPDRTALLTIANVDGLVIRGFRFDGNDDAVEDIVHLTGRCPGVRFEQCSFTQYKKRAFVMTDAIGAENDPIFLRQARFETGQKNQRQAALHLVSTRPDVGNQHVLVENCRFEGYFRAVLHLQGSNMHVRVEKSRFFTPPPPLREPKREHQPSDVVLIEDAPKIRLSVTNNTFLRYATGIHLPQTTLPDPGSEIIFRNNLILAMNAAVSVGPSGQDLPKDQAASLFPRFEGNLCRPTTCQGGVSSLKPTAATDIERLSDGVDDDRTFLRYSPASPLMRRGAGGGPVGAPPE